MKNILFVVDENKIGGVSSVLENILKKINTKKNNIDVLILHPVGNKFYDMDNINCINGSHFYSVVDEKLSDILHTKKINKILHKLLLIFLLKTNLIKHFISWNRKKRLNKKYDAEIAFKDGFCTIFTAYGNSKKKITWLHTDYSNNNPSKNYMYTFINALKKHDKIVAISQNVNLNFNKIFKMNNKTIVINNYIDSKSIVDKSIEFIPNLPDGFNIIALGRLDYVKGYDRLIKIFSKLNKDKLLDGVFLNIIGSGKELDNLQQMIIENNLNNKIFLLGNKENPFPYLKNNDLMVMTSRSEAYPTVILEANILKIPSIVMKFSSAEDMIINNITGIITKNDDEDFYEILKSILINKKIIKKIKSLLENNQINFEDIIDNIEKLWEENND